MQVYFFSNCSNKKWNVFAKSGCEILIAEGMGSKIRIYIVCPIIIILIALVPVGRFKISVVSLLLNNCSMREIHFPKRIFTQIFSFSIRENNFGRCCSNVVVLRDCVS